MAKNNFLIEQMKRVQKNINNITPEVYAGIALALHREYGWGVKRINKLFNESQDIWEKCIETNSNIIEMCEKETGIRLTN